MKKIKINFGSGANILKDHINVDISKSFGAQIIHNMNTFPYPFKDNYADEILCEMTLEHILYPTKAIEEFHRIIKKEGIIKIIVPHFSAPYALSADIHIRNYGVGYFYGFENNNKDMFNKEQKVVMDSIEKRFGDVKVKLVFPKGYMTIISLPFQLIFGNNKILQGVYEMLFSNFYRANEIHIIFKNKTIKGM